MPKKQRERRRRGDGGVSVAKRDANGRPILWKASISLGMIAINGKRTRNRPTEYADTEAEAYQKLKQMQAKHLSGDDMTPDKQTVEALLARWLEHIKAVRSAGTYAEYESRCRIHIIPAIGHLRLKGLKTAHVQAMLDALVTRGLEPNTIKGIRGTLTKALNTARKWGDIKVNVALDTEIPEIIQKKPLSLNDAQLARLLDVISGDPLEELILVALGTGGRIGECLGLLWANIDYAAQELHITGALKRWKNGDAEPGHRIMLVRDVFTKTKDERTIHMSPSVVAAFKARWQRQQQQRRDAGAAWVEQGLVFTNTDGRPLDPTMTTRSFKKLAARASLPPGFTFHSLRHSCATFLIKQGEHQRTIMGILGHRNPRTTARYGEVLPEVSRDALDKHSQRLNRRRGGEK